MRLLLLLPAILLSACSTPGPAPVTAPKPTGSAIRLTGSPVWSSMRDVTKAVGSKGTVSGNVLDLKGNILDGGGLKKPSNSQSEDAVPLKITIPGLTIRNGTIRSIPGGIVTTAKDLTVRKLVFLDIGEDALSTTGERASGLTVDQCRFYNDPAGDKSLQCNQAQGVTIRDSHFYSGITGVRLNKRSYNQKAAVLITGSTFKGCETGINLAGATTLTVTDCKFDVQKKWVIGEGGGKVTEK